MKLTIAFTGTHRRPMTPAQFERCTMAVRHIKPEHVHHGCCKGADRDFHAITSAYPRELHPAFDDQYWWATHWADLKPKDTLHAIDPQPLHRNETMVNSSKLLIACPYGMSEVLRSGTWATVRYARKRGIWVLIIRPDGTYMEEPTKFPF